MRRKMLMIVEGIVAVVALVMGGWYYMFCYMGIGPAFPFLPVVDIEIEGGKAMPLADNPLMAMVDTEEEAKEIAELYGITFVSYDNGIAVYQTDEDPMQVITRGQENDYPQLSLNLKREVYNDNGTVTLFGEPKVEEYYMSGEVKN